LGRFIKTTLSHPYLTLQGWQQLSDLKTGDKIAVPRQINLLGTVTIPDYQVKLMAYFIGDGCLTQTCPRFTNSNLCLQKDFTEAISHFQGVKVTCKTSQGTRTPTFYVTGDLDFVKVQRKQLGKRLKQLMKNRNLSNQKLAELLGVSDSLVSVWRTGKCVPSQKIFEKLCQILNVEEHDLINNELASISHNSKNPVTFWLQEVELWGKNAHSKTIPLIIFRLKKSLLSLFLNRLFATDGWASVLTSGQIQLGYCTVSQKMAYQIQHLLLRFGVIAHLKQRSIKYRNQIRIAWQLDITDAQSIKIFIEDIGIFGKEEAIRRVKEALLNKKYQTNCDLIPLEIWEQIALAKGEESWQSLGKRAGIQDASNLHVGKRSLSRNRLLKLALALNNLSLQQLATSEVYWDEIVSIEFMGMQQVYDLTIPETHNFVANDICVHNTAYGLSLGLNIARKHQLPVAIFSLEMSKEQLVLRLLASEAEIDSNRLRTGHFSQNELEPLNMAMAELSNLPIFIDDAANITVMQIRSQVRRLQSENKGQMGLVLIDYLQLMEGGGDNRVQELSKITRSLKGLAREVNAPVIALSQLSRAVESRTNKRPMMSDLRESGCLSGDSLIELVEPRTRVLIRELVGKSGFSVLSLNLSTMKLEKAIVTKAFCTGVKPIFCLKTRLGRTIKATANHQFLTIQGWKRLDELTVKSFIALPRFLPSSFQSTMTQSEVALLGHLIGDGCTLPRHSIQYTTKEKDLAVSDIYWDQVISIEYDGDTDVYDLTVDSPHHNFIANNIIVHNSIEQDADLIMMLYRDEYYNPDTHDRGIAEINIVKHRNGPTGMRQLLFRPEFTKFFNIQRSNNDY
jgi:replicative DNA helicase